jgi:MFS family permease
MIKRQFDALSGIYREYPKPFWYLMGASFIDSLGSALLFPFFTLYVTAKFGIGLSRVGLIFGGLMVANVIGSALGGGLADRFGRKSMIIFGLISSAFTVLALGLVNRLDTFIVITLITGLTGNIGGPARGAMVADLLPEAKRAGGFGLHRVIHNLAFVIGPALGGLLATRSYLQLFIFDTIASLVTAGMVFLLLGETKPALEQGLPQPSTAQTFRDYGKVMSDQLFMVFMLATSLMVLVYTQMQGPLAVFLRDVHGVGDQRWGYILSLNAGMVVVMQFWITRRVERIAPFLTLTLGTMFYVVGFGMYGYASTYGLFLLAMAIITLGEKLVAPVGNALAASLAPESMRGRYMAIYGFGWMIPSAVGMYLSGLIMDYADPRWIWFAAAIAGVVAAGMYFSLHLSEQRRARLYVSSAGLSAD